MFFHFFSAYFVKVFADIVCHVDTINCQFHHFTDIDYTISKFIYNNNTID